LERIESAAFANCPRLQRIQFPASARNIDPDVRLENDDRPLPNSGDHRVNRALPI
jgi:hypothetical protein